MTSQTTFWFVQHHECGTPLAIADPPACITMHNWGVSAAIEKQKRLLATRQSLAQCGNEW
jgi:hypothetical protein